MKARTKKYGIELNADGYELSVAALEATATASLQTVGAKIQCYQVAC